ncbi:hypothetical protein [Paenimyroides ceti]
MKHLKKLVVDKRLFFLFLIILIQGCGINSRIKSNYKQTNKLAIELFNENTNVISIQYEYANYAYLLTYTEYEVRSYKMKDGKIFSVSNFLKKENFRDVVKDFEGLSNKDFTSCIEMDGGYIFFKFNNKSLHEMTLGVNLKCFIETEFDSKFLNYIKEDLININKTDKDLLLNL